MASFRGRGGYGVTTPAAIPPRGTPPRYHQRTSAPMVASSSSSTRGAQLKAPRPPIAPSLPADVTHRRMLLRKTTAEHQQGASAAPAAAEEALPELPDPELERSSPTPAPPPLLAPPAQATVIPTSSADGDEDEGAVDYTPMREWSEAYYSHENSHHPHPDPVPVVTAPATAPATERVPQQLLSFSEDCVRAVQRLRAYYPVSQTRQVNCVVIGRPGNGKSSLLNSIYQTLTLQTTSQICTEGSTDAACTLRYACCTELLLHAGEGQRFPLVLFDTKGLPDSREPSTRLVIQALLRGKLRPAQPMGDVRWHDCALLASPWLKVDVVVFVYAYGTVFPHRLAGCVAEQAFARHVTVLPVITHYDEVAHDDQLAVHVDCCARLFNTPAVALTNLSAIPHTTRLLPSTAVGVTATAVVELVSQVMVCGQQHQRFKRHDVRVPCKLPPQAGKGSGYGYGSGSSGRCVVQ